MQPTCDVVLKAWYWMRCSSEFLKASTVNFPYLVPAFQVFSAAANAKERRYW